MGRTRIEIEYPEAEMRRNKARMDAARRFEYVDRAPAILGICPRYVLSERGVSWAEYFSDARTMMRHQLLNQKWIIENVDDDRCVAPEVSVIPDFENAANASGAGCEILWQESQSSRAVPFLEAPEDAFAYQPRDHTSGLWGKRLDWYRQMNEMADDFEVVFNGQRIPIRIWMAIGGESPFMCALDMAGDNFLIWLKEAPDAAHHLLEKLTDSFIQVETLFREIQGNPVKGGIITSDDPVSMLSLRTYREMIVPYTKRLYEAFSEPGGQRGMHMCGRNYHVIDALADDLKVTSMDGYGYVNPPEAYLEKLSGKAVLIGNIDPILLERGPKSEIRDACVHLLDVLGPGGGVVLQDGFNVSPGTPIEHLNILKQTSVEYGIPRGAAVVNDRPPMNSRRHL